MMTKVIRNILHSLGILAFWGIVLIGILFLFYKAVEFFIPDKEKYTITPQWIVVMGTISKIEGGEGYTPFFSYNVNEKSFDCSSYKDFSTTGFIAREKYMLNVNNQHPECYVPLDWTPLFTGDERRKKAIATIVRVWKFKYKVFFSPIEAIQSRYEEMFRYSVNGEEHERGQHLPPNFDAKNSSVKKGGSYEVEYWVDNPQRAIIHLDKPLKQ